ncbi:MAG: DsbA family protein [Chloroflexota bacterium]|nr:DsbA family protein [Chloroflexota bacterium]
MAASLDRLADSHPVDIAWRSYELRPKGSPPISPHYLARIEATRPRLYAIAREQYGLEINQGKFGIDSRPALIGAKFAESMGVGPAYHAAVMRAYWQAGQNIEEIEVLADIADAIGLRRMEFMDALDSAQLEQAVLDDIAQAQAYGINGVPALIFADKYLVSGAQPYDVLVQAVEQVAQELAKE